MSKVAIVTDSTAYLPANLLRGLDIHSVPLQVIWGEQTFRDGIDIEPDEFYIRLKDAKVMPSTSQPSPAAFKQIYSDLLERGYDILSVHISSRLSGTCDSAIQAQSAFPGKRIHIIDSLQTSLAMGFPILKAARAAAQGATLEDCEVMVREDLKQCGVLFLLSTLEFLRRGGRIGGAAAFLGTALGLKPILDLRDGRVEAMERVRTMAKATDRLLEIFEERVGSRSPISFGILHANAESEAQAVLNRARERFSVDRVQDAVIAPVSPVIGTHTGPGCLGIAYMVGM